MQRPGGKLGHAEFGMPGTNEVRMGSPTCSRSMKLSTRLVNTVALPRTLSPGRKTLSYFTLTPVSQLWAVSAIRSGLGRKVKDGKRMHAFDERLGNRWRAITLSIRAVEFDTADRRDTDRQLR